MGNQIDRAFRVKKNRDGQWQMVVGTKSQDYPGLALNYLREADKHPGAYIHEFVSATVDDAYYAITAKFRGDGRSLLRVARAIQSDSIFVPGAGGDGSVDSARRPVSMFGDARLNIVMRDFDFGAEDQAPEVLAAIVRRFGGNLDLLNFQLENSFGGTGVGRFKVHAQARFETFSLARAAHAAFELCSADYLRVRRLWDEDDETGFLAIAA